MPLIHSTHYNITVPCWTHAGRVRLAVLSDLHNNIYPGLMDILRSEQPDYVLIVGDMVNRPTGLTPPRFSRGYGCVSQLAGEFPVIYAPGNHESTWACHEEYRNSYRQYKKALEKKGVFFLENESVDLGDAENHLYVSGLELGKKQFTHHRGELIPPDSSDTEMRLGRPRPFQILLAHNPSYFNSYAEWGADLVLSGHLHGGQARIPGLGGLVGPGFRFFPPYTKGLYEEGETKMIVSAGLGTHTIPFRVLNPREVVIVDLVKDP